mgnify:CR=1 FL=1
MKKHQLTMTELPDLAADSVGQQAEQAALESHLEALQDQLREGPSAWLAKAIEDQKPADPDRFRKMEAEGWDE